MDYDTFKEHLNNNKVLYISRPGFDSKDQEIKFIQFTKNQYFKNWHKLYVHTSLLYKYNDNYFVSPMMFKEFKESELKMPKLAEIYKKKDLRLINDKKYYNQIKPLVKILNVNINELHHLINKLWKLFLLEIKYNIAKNYYFHDENLNSTANCQTNVRDILLLLTKKIIYPHSSTTLIGYDKYNLLREI